MFVSAQRWTGASRTRLARSLGSFGCLGRRIRKYAYTAVGRVCTKLAESKRTEGQGQCEWLEDIVASCRESESVATQTQKDPRSTAASQSSVEPTAAQDNGIGARIHLVQHSSTGLQKHAEIAGSHREGHGACEARPSQRQHSRRMHAKGEVAAQKVRHSTDGRQTARRQRMKTTRIHSRGGTAMSRRRQKRCGG